LNCIGDECAKSRSPAANPPAVGGTSRLLRGVAVGALCAGMGYHLATFRGRGIDESRHLATLAPPLVMVSNLAD